METDLTQPNAYIPLLIGITLVGVTWVVTTDLIKRHGNKLLDKIREKYNKKFPKFSQKFPFPFSLTWNNKRDGTMVLKGDKFVITQQRARHKSKPKPKA